MFAGNFGSPIQLLVLLAIILLLFGGNRLRNLGGDLGAAIKGFKKAVANPESDTQNLEGTQSPSLIQNSSELTKNKSHTGD